ncbi:sulfatase, alkaline phosphatase superfamily,membrane-bound [Lactiplantibacillus plantarum]|uniref:LTA synthase family protein n=1 Tax=Lactiplantibacillus plantarum TaxID=1590 RepID=UPI0009C22876|nr:alkaline phosphatase [Lactiplantibacillus plantarum]MCG0637983.1 sulfatase, alkaline phosphatase superfamily,membrane-bound [Lactiplantibacillus plantarum]MCG0644155.1 sulfatase, alkaline phosphatase superfamily,membrane-bound [Lactiplantibacillus plantarum]MCG0647253.1 sulfatase, alkaline phosphatase superfamily,membrane-bound [Lactiplantibacillus plantarum]MCG0653482.1 sulfatase, alkaline phosphatase superfamily,membrane-bound [Lactiplantibacillus plantarum]
MFTKFRQYVNTRIGFFWLLVFLFWAKTIYAYLTEFSLGVADPLQAFLMLVNPIATMVFLFSLAFYIRKTGVYYYILLFIDALDTILLYANVIYHREFTDFMTVSTITGVSKVSQGLTGSSLALASWGDVLYWADIIVILALVILHRIKQDTRPIKKHTAFAYTSAAIAGFGLNLTLAESNRPQLLTRTFDRTYIVKYLGIDAFTVYDGIKDEQTNHQRASAKKSELDTVKDYTESHYAAPNAKMYGLAKGRNVIVIHLESFQQFLIDQKVNGKEVTPFLNKLYHSNSTYSFKNFFHQVGQGKTSDAENMLETSTYGLSTGSLFSQLGSDNTFQAAPAILNQRANYSSAVFHGNVASFWNRNNTYKNMGYQYFFDASYFDTTGDKSTGYGLKDKLLFKNSVQYLERLQQPFYVKYITVTNHFPFTLDKEDTTFKTTDTSDSAINGYFQTAHYLDQSVKEFYTYLQKAGLLKNSMIVLYGDHYGLSNSENSTLAPILGKSADDWTSFDSAQLQRVPFMINIPGIKSGKVESTYGGEIDVLPTILHLLGISSKRYIQFGTDLFSKQHDSTVAFRNRDFVTSKYTVLSGKIYDNATGETIDDDEAVQKTVDKDQKKVDKELSLSDSLNNKNLLRFYTPKGFKKVDASNYNYADGLEKEIQIQNKLAGKSTSLYSKNGNKSTDSLYTTDAPEASHKKTDSTRIKITNPDDTDSTTTSSSSSK